MNTVGTDTILSTSGVGKEFNGVWVLKNVDFDLRPGEIHAVVGENGAGKSTFIKIISGVYPSSAGSLLLDGKPARFDCVAQSEAAGIRTVMQEINLVDYFSIYKNIFIGSELKKGPLIFKSMDDKQMRKRAEEVLLTLGVKEDVRLPANRLSVAMKKIVEICKVLVHSPRIVIFDEPTTSLGEEERDRLLSIIKDLKKNGLSIIYISHNLEEVTAIADRITVFRDGERISTMENEGVTIESIVKLMLGNKTYNNYKREVCYAKDEVLMEVNDICSDKLCGVSFNIKKGEVLGIAGVVGAGKTEVAKAIFGLDKVHKGGLKLNGKTYKPTPKNAILNGMAFVPEERQAEGLIPDFTNACNVSITYLKKWAKAGVLNKKEEIQTAKEYIDKLSIKTQGPAQLVKFLSGGNQQKVILSRWLTGDFKLGIFDEPTKGIDIKAKEDIYTLIDELAKQGKSIIMLSSYLPELLITCDRILVMRSGRIIGEFDSNNAVEDKLLTAMLGGEN
jgi:ABC-type sugar transport system ATPase subunit